MEVMKTQAVSPASSVAPSSAGTNGKTADAKGFDQTLVQVIGGTGSSVQPDTTAGMAAAAGISPTAGANQSANLISLSALLNGAMSASDLIKVIDQLLKGLDAASGEENSEPAAADTDKLSDALDQLDDLLAMLGVAPSLQQQMIPIPTGEAKAVADDSATGTDLPANNSAAAAAVASMMQQLVQPVSLSNETFNFSNSQALTNTMPTAVLISNLKEALGDLKSFLQNDKQSGAAPVSKQALSTIGSRLDAVSALIASPQAQQSTDANDAAAAASGLNTQAVIRTMQNSSSASGYMQRMGSQLLNASMMSVVSSQDETAAQPVDSLNGTPAAATAFAQLLNGTQPLVQQGPPAADAPTLQQPVQVQQFAQTMQGLIVKQFNVTGGNGIHEARITLMPEQLGQVDVRISVHNGQLTALFVTDTNTAKDMLENQMAQLRLSLQAHGLNVDKLEVSQNPVPTNMFQERQGQQNREQQSDKRGKSSKNGAQDEISFDADLEQLAVEQAVGRDLGLGRGIHTTA